MRREWAAIAALLFSLPLGGCFRPSGLEQQIRLESTVMAMQTDVAVELAELRELLSTPAMPPTSIPSPTASPVTATATSTSVPMSPPSGTVTTEVLNLRSGPSLEFGVVGHLQKGDALDIRARIEAGDWVKVSTDQGLEGWVAVEYVALNVPLDSIPLAVEIPPTSSPGPTAFVTPTAPGTPTATTASSAEG